MTSSALLDLNGPTDFLSPTGSLVSPSALSVSHEKALHSSELGGGTDNPSLETSGAIGSATQGRREVLQSSQSSLRSSGKRSASHAALSLSSRAMSRSIGSSSLGDTASSLYASSISAGGDLAEPPSAGSSLSTSVVGPVKSNRNMSPAVRTPTPPFRWATCPGDFRALF